VAERGVLLRITEAGMIDMRHSWLLLMIVACRSSRAACSRQQGALLLPPVPPLSISVFYGAGP
jgi:hypothetical protein